MIRRKASSSLSSNGYTKKTLRDLLEQGGWVHLNLPAITEEDQSIDISPSLKHHRIKGTALHPSRQSLPVLGQLKREMGSYTFAAQYQQTPAPAGGGLIKNDWFQYYDEPLSKQKGDQIYQSWDTASKDSELSDYSVCTTWLKRRVDLYLLNVHRAKHDFPALRKAVFAQYRLYKADTLIIEDKGSGISLIQDLRANGVYPKTFKPNTDKVTRMSNETPVIEAGHVWLPKRAPWLEGYLHELTRFPNAKHDDQVDSTSQALNVMWTYRKAEPRIRRL